MLFFIGTYSDETIIKTLKEKSDSLVIDYSIPKDGDGFDYKSDERIIKEVIRAGRCQMGLTHFFAKDISKAKNIAREMGLKDFAQVCEKRYVHGTDF